MKSQVYILSCVLLLLSFQGVHAQEFNMPPDITKIKTEDCITYKKDVLLCINYLQQDPWTNTRDKDKRMIANAFLIAWLSGCHEAGITLRPYVDQFSEVSSEFVALFMGGWAKYYYDTNDKNELACNLAGVKSVLDFYKSDKGVPKNAFMDKVVAIDKGGKLKKWVIAEMKKK